MPSIQNGIDYIEWGKLKTVEYEAYLKGFRERVNKYYHDFYLENKEAFIYMEPVSIFSFFIGNNSYNLFFSSNNDEFEYRELTLSKDEISMLSDMPDQHIENYFMDILHMKNCIRLEVNSFSRLSTLKDNWGYFKSQAYNKGYSDADLYYSFKNMKLSMNKHDISFSVINKDNVIDKVNNDNFTYQFNEAIKAYNLELYLASACLAVVCIETLLNLAVIKFTGTPPQNTYIYQLSNTLYNKRKIDGRLFNRLKAVNNLRHGIAHTATGQAQKWDVEQIFLVIQMLTDSLFN